MESARETRPHNSLWIGKNNAIYHEKWIHLGGEITNIFMFFEINLTVSIYRLWFLIVWRHSYFVKCTHRLSDLPSPWYLLNLSKTGGLRHHCIKGSVKWIEYQMINISFYLSSDISRSQLFHLSMYNFHNDDKNSD